MRGKRGLLGVKTSVKILVIVLALFFMISFVSAACPAGTDPDGSGSISLSEISAFVSKWLNGEISLSEASAGVSAWLNGCSGPSAKVIRVWSSGNDGNFDYETLDGILNDTSRWASLGDGEWVAYELNQTAQVNYVRFAFYSTSQRYFDIQYSTNNITWTNASAGLVSQANMANEWQTFNFPTVNAKYIRYLGHGSVNPPSLWNSIVETDINGFSVDLVATTPVCGNGVVEGTEACDLGSSSNGACPSTCSLTCTVNSCVTGTTFYVSTAGSDINSGTSQSTPWKTIAKVNGANLQSGDAVAFKGGEVFSDAVLNSKVGVTYTSYGTGKAQIGNPSGTTSTTATIVVDDEDVTINNLKIYGYRDANRVITYSKGGLKINNNEIIGGVNAHSSGTFGIAGTTNGITKQVSIAYNDIHDFDKGIYLPQPYNVDISYNKIYNVFRYTGYQNVGGNGIQANSGGIADAFNSAYTFHIHHNEIYNFEHVSMYVGSVSRALVEYNYIHDNLDERLYMGGIKHGTVGKFYDNTNQILGSVGNIFRYNYVYNLQRRGLSGYTYSRPTKEQIIAGEVQVISTGGSNPLAAYVTPQGGTWSLQPDAVISGLGYGNVWVHNNIFDNSTHQVFSRGYTKFDPITGLGGSGDVGQFRADLPAYFLENTIISYGIGNTGITNEYGLVYGEVTNQAPTNVFNNIFNFVNDYARTGTIYKEEQTSIDYNIYTSPRNGTTTSTPSYNSHIATWFQYSPNLVSGAGEKYLTTPNWVNPSGTYFAANIGPNGVYIPDVRLTSSGSAKGTGKAYSTIGDTYTDTYGTHELGKDPTGRSFAYNILGELRTTNNIGAL